MHTLTIKTLFFLSQFAVFFYVTATHPIKDTNREYRIVSKRIKESDQDQFASLYREIENGGKYGRLPSKRTSQDSLFAAYESEIKNSISIRLLFGLWKKISDTIVNKADKALFSEKQRKALKKMIKAQFSTVFENDIDKAIEMVDPVWLFGLLETLGEINDDLLSERDLNEFKAQIKANLSTVLKNGINKETEPHYPSTPVWFYKLWEILEKINDDLLSKGELKEFKAQIKAKFPTVLENDINEATAESDGRGLYRLKGLIGSIKTDKVETILSSTQKKEYLKSIDERNNWIEE
jgi:flagellar biosynthesis component FlhA